jgi:hypothetical protein
MNIELPVIIAIIIVCLLMVLIAELRNARQRGKGN